MRCLNHRKVIKSAPSDFWKAYWKPGPFHCIRFFVSTIVKNFHVAVDHYLCFVYNFGLTLAVICL